MKQTNTLKWVTDARVVGDYLLELDFNDGRRVVFDCQPLINQYKLFAPLCPQPEKGLGTILSVSWKRTTHLSMLSWRKATRMNTKP